MMLCSYMLDNVVRNRLVLVLLKSVPWLMIYDVICVKISMANIFARFLFHLERLKFRQKITLGFLVVVVFYAKTTLNFNH